MKQSFFDTPGEKYEDFTLKRVLPIEELSCCLKEIVHEPTGARIIHIGCDDPENLFCLSFQTLPSSSNGAAHILEHTVLCGSKRFPVKDPFFAMNRRSLNTFMNALTGADFTCYPAASQVEKDFYNLLDVYLDAVFHPHLRELSFLQEGHRLEFAEPENPNSPLEMKGIVYNEMKGGLSSADTRLWHAMMADLCPDLPYAYNSGGDPKIIPKLSYEELIQFHKTYYHPSRCLFFFYGNLPLKQHLAFIDQKALKEAVKEIPLPPIPHQKRFSTPVSKKYFYPIQESENLKNQVIFGFGWLTAQLKDQEEVLALTLLDAILMDTDASPLKHALLKSGLCVQAEGFMDTEMSEVPYIFVCKGCQEENQKKLKEVLFKSLEKIANEGISPSLVDAALHQLEFSRTEITGDHAPFGLTLFMRSALAMQHGCPPENALQIHALFDKLRNKTRDPHYLSNLIRKYFLNNAHLVELTLIPDPELNSRELTEEKEHLEKIRSSLSKNEIDALLKQAKVLEKYQKQTEEQDLDCLPKMSISDVPVLSRDFVLKQEKFEQLSVYHHNCFTNHILYVDWVFNLPHIEDEELPYISLLMSLLPEIGAGERDYVENLQYIQAHTGGIGAFASLNTQVDNPSTCRPAIVLRGRALARKKKELFTLLKNIATSARFDDHTRIEELILKQYAALQNRLTRNALRYAIQTACSGFSSVSYIQNRWSGLPYYNSVELWAKEIKTEIPKICKKLAELHHRIFSAPHADLVVSCDQDLYEAAKHDCFGELLPLGNEKQKEWRADFTLPVIKSHASPISSQVAFTCEAFRTAAYLHPHAPALGIAALLFENTVLHARIREQGGAYGAGASYNAVSGSFYFHSFRDPQLVATLEAFSDAIKAIAEGDFDEQDLEEAKLGLIQHMDSPVAPGSRAATAYSWLREGRTLAVRQNFRDRLLALTQNEITRSVQKELLAKKDQGIAISFAGKEQLENQSLLPIKELFK